MVNPSVLKGRARQAENPAAKASRNARFLGHGAVECQSKQGETAPPGAIRRNGTGFRPACDK
jgi:hypothetical protein